MTPLSSFLGSVRGVLVRVGEKRTTDDRESQRNRRKRARRFGWIFVFIYRHGCVTVDPAAGTVNFSRLGAVGALLPLLSSPASVHIAGFS
jgi:hypothetical protein